MSEESLKMTFEPDTIEHLGVRMYSTLPPVLAELIANAHDADAESVELHLKDTGEEKEIIIKDDGIGMSFDEINRMFLRIGRNRRFQDDGKPAADKTGKGRLVIGRKGLGKLSFFGIAREIIITTEKNGEKTTFIMRWDDIKSTNRGEDYQPKFERERGKSDGHGTTVTLKQIQRVSDFDVVSLAKSISKMFILEEDFSIILMHNDDNSIKVENEMRFADLDINFEWDIPSELPADEFKYFTLKGIKGKLMTSETPISPRTGMRGIILFSRKKLVNRPEYYTTSTSSHFFSYLTGYLQVDFIDNFDDDVISTNRQTLNWDYNEETIELRNQLRKLINWTLRDWKKRKKESKEIVLAETTGIIVPNWVSTMDPDDGRKVEDIVTAIHQDAELPPESTKEIVKTLHDLVPEYPRYKWRHLHEEIRNATFSEYMSEQYYSACLEAIKAYIAAVEHKSGVEKDSYHALMTAVFPERLSVTKKYSDNKNLKSRTLENIEKGQKYFSMGVIQGARNPLAHPGVRHLEESGLFTKKDCLDVLSLLSHLFRRLDDAEKVEEV